MPSAISPFVFHPQYSHFRQQETTTRTLSAQASHEKMKSFIHLVHLVLKQKWFCANVANYVCACVCVCLNLLLFSLSLKSLFQLLLSEGESVTSRGCSMQRLGAGQPVHKGSIQRVGRQECWYQAALEGMFSWQKQPC